MADAGMPLSLESALTLLYSDPHRAFFRLLVDDLIARRHLRHIYDEVTWPSHIACGDTKPGKSLMPVGSCRLFGWTYRHMRKFVPKETEKSMWGRRSQRPGGAWVFQPAGAITQPLLFMDELDKAAKAVRDAAGNSLPGDVLISTEDRDVEIIPVVLITSDAKPSTFLLEYRRRSIVFDTRAIDDDLPVSRNRPARDFLDALPRWNVDQLVPLDWPISPILDAVNSTIIPGLNEDGRRLYDEGTLALLVLGRAAWTRPELEAAVDARVGDYLDCAGTVDETLRPVATNLALPDATARRLADARRAADEAESRRQERADILELEARKGDLLDELRHLGKAANKNTAHIRQIRRVMGWIENTETPDELDELEDDLEALREAPPVTSDNDRSAPQAWRCSRFRRLLGSHELDACALCRQADQVIPASKWMQLADTLGRSMGTVDVAPVGAEPTPIEKAYADTAAWSKGAAHNRPALPPASGPVYFSTCGSHFTAVFLAEHQWSTSVVCPRHRRRVSWKVIPSPSPQKSRPALPR